MPINHYSETGLSLYVLFGDTNNEAVALTEGSSLKAGLYTVTDATIAGTGLIAGEWPYRILVGTAGSASASDPQDGVGSLSWDGTNEITSTSLDTAIGSVTPSATPLTERPSAPNRTRKVRRSITGGLTFDAITVRLGDSSAVWCLDFATDLAQGTGIASVEAPTFDAETGLDVTEAPERTGDRPSKGVVLKFDPTTAGSYTMTMEVTYGDSQGTHTVQGTVTVLAGAE